MRMFVCLCRAVTSDVIGEAIARGARTSRAVADACGAGTDCGRCRQTVRAIITAMDERGTRPSDIARMHRQAISAAGGGLAGA
jgi:bacterioferritin-associated ferredoxin